jgi:hypothetical protein
VIKLLKRDGYRCVLLGCADLSHPLYKNSTSDSEPLLTLEGCHIIRRAIALFDSKDDGSAVRPRSADPDLLNLIPSEYQSAVTTIDILRNYADISETTLTNLTNLIDDASNGLLLQSDAHNSFDKFAWCLQPTEVRDLILPWNIESQGYESDCQRIQAQDL